MRKFLYFILIFWLLISSLSSQEYYQNYRKGYDLFKKNKLLEAKEYLEKALSNYPRHFLSLKLLAEIYTRLNRYDEAIIYYKKILLLNPQDIEAKINLADVYAWKGALDRAIGLFKEVLEEEPKNLSARLGLAKVFRWAQRFEEAKDQYIHILKRSPANIEALIGLAKTYSFLGVYSEALQIISRAISLSPDNSELYREKGEILSWQKRFQEAELVYQKSLNLNSRDPETYQNLGNLYSWSKKYNKAIEAYSKAYQLEPGNINHLLDKAKTYLLWHRIFQAERVLKNVLKQDPQNSQALKLLQEIRQKSKIDLMKIIEKYVEPILILSIMIIILIYFRKKIDILKYRQRFYWIFIYYFLPFLLVIGLIGFSLTLWSDFIEPYTEATAEIIELSLIFLLCLAFISLSWFRKNDKKIKGKVLAIGAHPDDIELGCGGTLAKLKHEGAKVYAMILSLGEKGGAELDKRKKEAQVSAKYLNLDDIWLFDFPDTKLQESASQIIFKIEEAVHKAKITTILTHSPNDIHQDHRAVLEACRVAARGDVSLICYEDVRTDQGFIPNFFIDITEFIDMKLKLVKFHKSQREKPYMDLESLKGRAAHRGFQAGVKYAEAFFSYKIVEK